MSLSALSSSFCPGRSKATAFVEVLVAQLLADRLLTQHVDQEHRAFGRKPCR